MHKNIYSCEINIERFFNTCFTQQAYLDAYDDQRWPKTVNLEKGETVIMHNSNVMVHFSATSNDNDEWTGEDIRSRPKVVRRGIDDFESEIDDGRR